MTEKRHQWASNLGFILAAAGSAVGLGNIWKFPGKVGAYGGGAFLLCYLLIVFLVGFPVMLAELSIGRATQKNVVGAFRTLNPRWRFAGYIGIVTLFVILSYYCVVGGWVLKYVQIYAARPLRRRAGRLCRLLLRLQCPSGGAPAVGPGLSGAVHRGGGAGRVPGH